MKSIVSPVDEKGMRIPRYIVLRDRWPTNSASKPIGALLAMICI
jgi:hypothetical protein